MRDIKQCARDDFREIKAALRANFRGKPVAATLTIDNMEDNYGDQWGDYVDEILELADEVLNIDYFVKDAALVLVYVDDAEVFKKYDIKSLV
jgi:hypothetical protein